MNESEISYLIGIENYKDFAELSAADFEYEIACRLEIHGNVKRQVAVKDRGDGRRGRIDIVFLYQGRQIPIEIDRMSVRAKSVFKVLSFNAKEAFCITRSPYVVKKVSPAHATL